MTTIKPLSPETLGIVGEDLFRSLCSTADLVCNKSERDLSGWDFRVELPWEDHGGSLDRRSPRACQIQVKTTAGESGSRVTAKLSAVERLAKDAAPAAIIILRLRRDGSPLAGYVVHLIDDELGRLLHRLRRAAAEGRSDLNHMTISFDYAKARRFELTPSGLRAALEEVCSQDVGTYTSRKQDQLARLGEDDDGAIEAEALVWIESKDHSIRMLSGLAPVKPLQIRAFDKRFGIRLPYEGDLLDGLAEITLQLPTAGPCEIAMHQGPRDRAAVFQCEAFVPPPLEDEPMLVIRHPMLTAFFRSDGLQLETTGNFLEGQRSLADWGLMLRGLSYMASGNGTITMTWKDVRLPGFVMPENALDGPYIEELPWLLRFVDDWTAILAIAGVSATDKFSLPAIWEAKPVHVALDILMNPSPVARLEFDVIVGAEDEDQLDALYFNTVAFAGAAVSFAVKARLARKGANPNGFASTAFELLDVRPAVIDLKAYGAERASESRLVVVIDPDNLILVEPAPEIDTPPMIGPA
jgi:hypothetical protein